MTRDLTLSEQLEGKLIGKSSLAPLARLVSVMAMCMHITLWPNLIPNLLISGLSIMLQCTLTNKIGGPGDESTQHYAPAPILLSAIAIHVPIVVEVSLCTPFCIFLFRGGGQRSCF